MLRKDTTERFGAAAHADANNRNRPGRWRNATYRPNSVDNANILLDNTAILCAECQRRYQKELIIAYNGGKDGA
jgi:hypothetical protein